MTYSVLCMQSTHIGSSVHCTQENGERYFLNCILGPLKILNNQTTWNIFVPILTFYKNCTMSNLHQIADSIVNDSLMRQTWESWYSFPVQPAIQWKWSYCCNYIGVVTYSKANSAFRINCCQEERPNQGQWIPCHVCQMDHHQCRGQTVTDTAMHFANYQPPFHQLQNQINRNKHHQKFEHISHQRQVSHFKLLFPGIAYAKWVLRHYFWSEEHSQGAEWGQWKSLGEALCHP
jgi:hypothetical protein